MGNAAGVDQGGPDGDGVASPHPLQTLTRQQVEDIAKINKVSVSDVLLLYERFRLLRPDKNGLISRSVFEVEPYIQDPFCVQLWRRMSGESSDQDKISFSTFTKTMFWWQQAPVQLKLELLFTWMSNGEGISVSTFSKIVGYTLPQYSREEAHQIAKQAVQIMTGSENETSVNLQVFLSWFSKVPQDGLNRALDFKILNITQQK